jgi:cold shock CspA family protein
MKHFGKLRTYDGATGAGSIRPESSGAPIIFDKAAVSWRDGEVPQIGARLSYYIGNNLEGAPVALNLRPAEPSEVGAWPEAGEQAS